MNITKKRLIQIIKEELQHEAAPMPSARDMEINEPPGVGGTDPTAVAANILGIIGTHPHPHQVIQAFVELLNPTQRESLAMILVSSMGNNPALSAPEVPRSEYGQKTGMGFVKTREDLERMIGNELATLLEELNTNEAIEDEPPHEKDEPPRTLYDDGKAQGHFDMSADAFFIKTPGVPGEQAFNDVPELVQHYAGAYNPEGMTFTPGALVNPRT